MTRVLIVDDNPDDRMLVERELRGALPGMLLVEVRTPDELDAALHAGFDAAITDYQLQWATGLDVFRRLHAKCPDCPVIMFTASGSEEIAVAALKEGLADYITKTPQHYPRIPYALHAALEGARARSELRAAREGERATAARLQIALDTAGMAAWTVDVAGPRFDYADGVGPLFGRARGFVHPSADALLEDLLPEDAAATEKEWCAALTGRRDRLRSTFRIRTPSGRTRWLECVGRIERDDAGRAKSVLGVVSDATTVQAGQTVRDAQSAALEAATRHDLDEALAAVARGTLEAIEPTGRATLFLRNGEEWVAKAEAGDAALRVGPLLAGMPVNRQIDDVATCPATGGDVALLRSGTGAPLGALVLAIPGSEPLRSAERERLHELARTAALIVGLERESRERTRAEAELREADRQKDQFLATLAHELRNPMAPIRYAAAMLRTDAPPATLARAREVIERQSRQMARLLDDLLDLSRITRNVVELKRAPVDLRAIVDDAIDAVRPALDSDRRRLIVQRPERAVVVHGDPVRLRQIAGNLLDNAIKYTRPGGCIRIAVCESPPWATLVVEDDGIGLAPEEIPLVFRMFAQVRRPGEGAVGGLGIGLAVSRRLTELHGGTLEVASAGRDSGARFTVTLPQLLSVDALPLPANPGRLGAAPPGPIVVVDDNQDAADSLAACLQAMQVEVAVAYDGRTALETADRVRPHSVVLDVGLPDLDGLEVARTLRARPWAADLRIVGVTGWGQPADRERTASAGFDAHLVKPVALSAVLDALRGVPSGPAS
jgi:signal transduction histidine kinase/DNA-binding response OmpR family regulator